VLPVANCLALSATFTISATVAFKTLNAERCYADDEAHVLARSLLQLSIATAQANLLMHDSVHASPNRSKHSSVNCKRCSELIDFEALTSQQHSILQLTGCAATFATALYWRITEAAVGTECLLSTMRASPVHTVATSLYDSRVDCMDIAAQPAAAHATLVSRQSSVMRGLCRRIIQKLTLQQCVAI
jgi:hypothetical protein